MSEADAASFAWLFAAMTPEMLVVVPSIISAGVGHSDESMVWMVTTSSVALEDDVSLWFSASVAVVSVAFIPESISSAVGFSELVTVVDGTMAVLTGAAVPVDSDGAVVSSVEAFFTSGEEFLTSGVDSATIDAAASSGDEGDTAGEGVFTLGVNGGTL